MNKNTYLLHKDNNKIYPLPEISLQFDRIEKNKFVNKKEYDRIIEYKNNIDNLEDNKLWDTAKKLCNNSACAKIFSLAIVVIFGETLYFVLLELYFAS